MDALEIKITASAEKATSGISSLVYQLTGLKELLSRNFPADGFINRMNRIRNAVDGISGETIAKISALTKAFDKLNGVDLSKLTKATKNIKLPAKTASEVSQETRAFYEKLDKYFPVGSHNGALDPANNPVVAMNEAIVRTAPEATRVLAEEATAIKDMYDPKNYSANNTPAQMEIFERNGGGARLTAQMLKEFSVETENATKNTFSLKQALSGLTGMFGKVGGLFKSVGRIMKTMAIRAAIRGIIKGVKEGIQNLYQWSSALNGSFAQSMDSAKSSITTMKNAFATALAPAIQALIPVLQTVIGWIRTASNAIAQFFALLSGRSSWTRATDAVETYADAVGGAGGATSAWLADWDELNVMNQGGGGGGGGVGTDYADMFEETMEFAPGIRKLVEYLEEHLPLIKDLAIAAGAGLATLTLTHNVKLALVVAGITLSYEAGRNIGYAVEGGNEISSDNLLEAFAGALTTTLGAAGLGFTVGGGGGALIGVGVGLVLSITSFIVGFAKGTKARTEDNFWGDVMLERSKIESIIKGMFNIDVPATIKLIDATLANEEQASQKIDDAVLNLKQKTIELKLGIETSDTTLLEDVNAVVDSINGKLSAQKKTISALISLDGFANPNGETSPFSAGLTMTEALSGVFTGLGEKISERIAEGIKYGEGDILDALITTLQNATQAYQLGELKGTFSSGMASALSKGTAEEIIGGFVEQKALVEGEVTKLYDQALKDAYGSLASAEQLKSDYEAMGFDTSEVEGVIAKAQAWINILENGEDGTGNGKQSWIDSYVESITAGYIEKIVQFLPKTEDMFTPGGKANYMLYNTETAGMLLGQKTGTSEWLSAMYDGLLKDYADKIGLSYNDLINAGIETKDVFSANTMASIIGNAFSVWGFDLNSGNASDFYQNIISAFGEEFGTAVYDELMKGIEDVPEYLKGTKTDEGASEVYTPKMLMRSLMYDNADYSEAVNWETYMNRKGIYPGGEDPYYDYIFNMMNESEETISTDAIQDYMDALWDAINSGSPDIMKDVIDSYSGKYSGDDILDNVWMYVMDWVENLVGNGIHDLNIDNDHDWLSVGRRLLTPAEMKSMQFASAPWGTDVNFVPMGSGTVDTGNSLYNQITQGVAEGMNRSVNSEGYAQRIQDGMVAAMARTNSEMSTQTGLLRTIANKSFVVNVTPSSGLGGVNKRSSGMYEKAVGV